MNDAMAIRFAVVTLLGGMFALATMTWGEMRVLRAERDAEIAELNYVEALVRKRIVELEEFNRGLDLHIQTLQSSYPRVRKTSPQNNSTF